MDPIFCLNLVDPSDFPLRPPRCSWHRVRIAGRGSYGVVYLAFSARSDGQIRPVAVKTTTQNHASYLANEYRICKALEGCPEIVRCHYDEISFELRGRFYNVVMEYASAGSLRDLIGRSDGAGLPEPRVRAYTRMILSGLDFMHSRGYVHCDLKPENILAFPKADGYELKLADFGITKEPGEETPRMTWRGRFRGTPTYMSPESVEVGLIGPKLDVWSLGCVVVNMVTGRCAWDGMFSHVELYTEDFAAGLVSHGASPMVPESLSGQGKDFLNKCLDRSYRTRWSAKMLLHHPFVLSLN